MADDEASDDSSNLSSPPASPILPPSFYPTPSPSPTSDTPIVGESEEQPAPKRRKITPKIRVTQHLNLNEDASQPEYDRQNAMDLLLKSLKKRRKIVVVAGAGISVSAGIPDFRSSHGLFEAVKQKHKLKASGKGLFDASVYRDDSSTSSFHEMVRDLSNMAAEAKPTPFHRLLARLAQEGRLLRLYTQNIDELETSLPPLATQAPLNPKAPWPQTIQLHGGLEKMMCQKCQHTSESQPDLFHGATPPSCPRCAEADSVRTYHAGKRSHGVGRLRPRIVLYNEHNPDEDAIGAVMTADLRTRPDAIIVVGTSMKIPGVKRIVKEMCGVVRGRRNGTAIWINRDPVPVGKGFEDCWDLVVQGESDDVARIAQLKEWDDFSDDSVRDCSLSEVERVQARQGTVSVVVPETSGKWKKGSLPDAGPGVLTPSNSQDEEQSDTGGTPAGLVSLATECAPVQNPASQGRSIADVLGKQVQPKPHGRPKAQTKKRSGLQVDKAKQGKLAGKITKSSKLSMEDAKDGATDKPLPSSKNSQIRPIIMFPNLSPRPSSAFPETSGHEEPVKLATADTN